MGFRIPAGYPKQESHGFNLAIIGVIIAVVLFLMAAIFIIPYLLSSHRERRGK